MSCRTSYKFSFLVLEEKIKFIILRATGNFTTVLKYYIRNNKMSNCIQKVKFHPEERETKLNKTPITFKIRENIKNTPTLEATKRLAFDKMLAGLLLFEDRCLYLKFF